MRHLPLILCLALAACAPAEKRSSSDLKTYDVSAPPPPGVAAEPNIAVTAAPGVAFVYRYAYNLPDARIARVQEAHAAACEKLGVTRCRITGLRYTVRKGETVDATLAVKLAPEFARAFGRQATDLVAANDGRLVESAITGDDAGAIVTAARAAQRRLYDERARLEAQLRDRSLTAAQRGDVQARLAELRGQAEASRAERTTAETALAATPMTFDYSSGGDIPGFGRVVTIREALASGWDSIAMLVSLLVMAVVVVGPWLLVLGLLLWAFRRWLRPHVRLRQPEEVLPN